MYAIFSFVPKPLFYSCKKVEATLPIPSHTHISGGSGSGCTQKVVGKSQCQMQPLESSFSGSAGEGKGEVERGRKMGKRQDRK